MSFKKDVIIVGGGLAGLMGAILLAKAGLRVLLLEKKQYPFHKVCGEYISNEVLPLLNSCGIDPFAYGATRITHFMLTGPNGQTAQTALPLGGFGISRFTLDHLLYRKALELGAEVQTGRQVDQVSFKKDAFSITTQDGTTYFAPIAIGAHGKRDRLDQHLSRAFSRKRSPYVAVKAHYRFPFPEHLVALHSFGSGYCGVSMVEDEKINICYLIREKELKKHGSLKAVEEKVLYRNPYLKKRLQQGKLLFSRPLAISQIYFQPKELIAGHMLMTGDAAGMIYPLCGNGMSMALHSALLLSRELQRYFSREYDRAALETAYAREWNRAFSRRLKAGRRLQPFLMQPGLLNQAVNVLGLFPGLLPPLIKQTHGRSITLLPAI